MTTTNTQDFDYSGAYISAVGKGVPNVIASDGDFYRQTTHERAIQILTTRFPEVKDYQQALHQLKLGYEIIVDDAGTLLRVQNQSGPHYSAN